MTPTALLLVALATVLIGALLALIAGSPDPLVAMTVASLPLVATAVVERRPPA